MHIEEEDDDMVDEVVLVVDEVDEVDDIMLVVDVLVNDTIELLDVMIALTVLDEVDDEPEVLDMLERAQHYDELDEMVCWVILTERRSIMRLDDEDDEEVTMGQADDNDEVTELEDGDELM